MAANSELQRSQHFPSTSSLAGSQQSPSASALDPNQKNLLLAALSLQAQRIPDRDSSQSNPHHHPLTDSNAGMGSADRSSIYISPQSAKLDYTPDDLDYLDGDSFDFDNADLGGEMIGSLPGSFDPTSDQLEHHEKRKSPDDKDDEEGNSAKRQETQDGDRVAKKPGRKPLTNEPTTKRKAQNRAAQRAFRERKEKHLKDLETKVEELTKSQEADKHEKSMLKAEVDRLQVELREYRKRLSLNSSRGSGNRSPTYQTQQNRNSGVYSANNAFQFDFPKFGATNHGQAWVPTDSTPKRQSTASSYGTAPAQSPSTLGQHDSTASPQSIAQAQSPPFAVAGFSTASNMHGFAATLPQMNPADPFGDLFSPSLLKTTTGGTGFFDNASAGDVPTQANSGGESTAGFQRAFHFNSGPTSSASASPSASSASQWNVQATNSSCGTSPEPSHDSPANKDKTIGSPADQFHQTLGKTDAAVPSLTDTSFLSNADFTVPSSTTFDPVLFGGYRDNGADTLFGATDFSGALFDDRYSFAGDMASPSNLFGILQSPQPISNAPTPETTKQPSTTQKPSDKFLANLEKARDGGDDDYGLQKPMSQQQQTNKMVSCNVIWNQLQSNPDFQDGTFDLDSLCSELRAKAKCSESGVMVPQEHVDAALRKLGTHTGKELPAKMPNLLFEQESWDNVLKKLGNGPM